jgi:hypothetical protein
VSPDLHDFGPVKILNMLKAGSQVALSGAFFLSRSATLAPAASAFGA